MLLRLSVAAILALNVISAAIAQPIQRPTLLDAQSSCLKVAQQSGQNKISPIGVRKVCELDTVITPVSVAMPGSTGVVGQPEIDNTLTPCKDSVGAVVPHCWIK